MGDLHPLTPANPPEQSPKSSLRPAGGPPYDEGMEARVAVLEQIARNTEQILARMDVHLDRMDTRMDRIEDRQRSDFRWLLTTGAGATAIILGTTAHGFHWI